MHPDKWLEAWRAHPEAEGINYVPSDLKRWRPSFDSVAGFVLGIGFACIAAAIAILAGFV